MSYITREDGVHFVVPAYREVISVKQKSALKKEILVLSEKYGEYITLQDKAASQYELAFSPEAGYLLGESIWDQFNKPAEMIYCEAIPNSTEAILVIVKSGSVYLDGSFPLDSITEELVIFLTQQNHFEIYTYGDVPLVQFPEEGKFSFEAASVQSFKELDKPVFPTLLLNKNYHLQLVDTVLKEKGIGVLPIKQLLIIIILVVAGYFGYSYLTTPPPEAPPPPPPQENPYQPFLDAMQSPAPDQEMQQFLNAIGVLFTMPGWEANAIDYKSGKMIVTVQTKEGSIESLQAWAKSNGLKLNFQKGGLSLSMDIKPPKNRPSPTQVYQINDVFAHLLDGIARIYPGNRIQLGGDKKQGPTNISKITISIDGASPVLLELLSKQFKDLPMVLRGISLTLADGKFNGTINIDILGN